MAQRLKLVSNVTATHSREDRIVALLSDGIPRSYAELSAEIECSYLQAYNSVGRIINGEDRSPILIRQFKGSNRHYITMTKFATKLGAIWNTDQINRPITFRILLQLKGKA